MAGRGTRATAADYNAVQTTISNVLGIGSGTSGYGQFVASSPVSAGATITVAQWTNIRADLAKARQHQTNVAVVDGLASIAANRGSPFQTLQVITASTSISEDIRDQYDQFASGTNSNRALAAAAQLSSATNFSTTNRTTNWGGATDTISHTVTMNFGGYTSGSLTVPAADHARCFFNAGGSIRISASRTGGSGTSKDTNWSNMLSLFGTFTFGSTSSSVSGSINSGGSIASSTGFHSLTVGAGATTVFSQAASSVYVENRYTIAVARPTASQLVFTITFADNDAGDLPVPSPPPPYGPLVDEEVTGTLSSVVDYIRPVGSNVDVPAPTGSASAL